MKWVTKLYLTTSKGGRLTSCKTSGFFFFCQRPGHVGGGERDRETETRAVEEFFYLRNGGKKKIRERCILFCVFLDLEIGI